MVLAGNHDSWTISRAVGLIALSGAWWMIASTAVAQAPGSLRAEIRVKIEAASAAYQAGNNDDAVRIFQEVVALDPRHVLAWHFLGQTLARKGDIEAAVNAYKKVIEIQPTGDVADRTRDLLAKAEMTLKKDGAEMVLVPAGEFWMGSDEGFRSENPRRRVHVGAFHIDKFEITYALFRRFAEATGNRKLQYLGDPANAQRPVGWVSWFDANDYCRWAGKRLPTEAEWEKAARGTDGRRYPWGNQWDGTRAATLDRYLATTGAKMTLPVGSLPSGASPYGALDMVGNVEEWVADWYDVNYYRTGATQNPKGPQAGSEKVIRGGGAILYQGRTEYVLRTTTRRYKEPAAEDEGRGFRCAIDAR